MAETHIAPQILFLVTLLILLANTIHRSTLIKMVPRMESSGNARGPILAHGLPVSINVYKNKKLMKQNGGHFKSIQHPKQRYTGHFDHPNWPTGAKDIDI